MCLYPQLIKNPKYTATKKNGGIIPPITDPRIQYVPRACTKCIECCKQKAREWQARLLEDIKTNTNAKFITFTLSNEQYTKLANEVPQINGNDLDGYDLDNEIATIAVHRMLNRHRKQTGKSLRHWLVTELGHEGTENIHLHGIIWTDMPLEQLETEIWQYGYTWKGKYTGKTKHGKPILENYVNGKTISYITKYVNKTDEKHKTYKAKILTSKGIGSNYTRTSDARNNRFMDTKTKETYRTPQGFKIAMPIYWRNKLYTEQQREQLWLNKLDKQQRYVCGERIDISKDEKTYYNVLNWHRKRNKELGYGNDEKNWELIRYERQRRNLKINERINATETTHKLQNNKEKLPNYWDNN